MRLLLYIVLFQTSVITLVPRAVKTDELPVQVGMVLYLNASAEHYKLQRGNEFKAVKPAMTLQEKDVLTLDCARNDNKPGSEEISINIQKANNDKKITCKDSPYTLEGNHSTSPFKNFFNWGLSVIASTLDSVQSKPYSAIVRGDNSNSKSNKPLPLYMPLICRTGGRMVASRPDLYLTWIGGNPPYKFRMSVENETKIVAEQTGLDESRIALKKLDLQPNSYKLVITDARGHTLSRHFQVVSQDSLPMPEHVVLTNGKDQRLKNFRETAYAAWLSDQDRGIWTLEAYQHIAGIAREYYPAELLRRKLADGL